MEGKIITCCGDCVHYDWKKHRCMRGNSEEGTAQQHFYQDCKIFEDLEEHDAKVRTDAIEECKMALLKAFDETNINEYGFYPQNVVDMVAEQLKEHNNG